MQGHTTDCLPSQVPASPLIDGFLGFVSGPSHAMRTLERVVADIALTDIPVLLVGESGTGKEIAAMQIHRLSRRSSQPFVKIVCSTLTPDSFNGQSHRRNSKGDFSPAPPHGTLFLDDISDLEGVCQPRLLQLLSDGHVSGGEHPFGARLVSATNRNLEEEMRSGRFREELYYRINGLCLRLPPLRHRKEDIPALAEFFLRKYANLLGRPQPSLRPQTLRALQDHHWPGNVRELENVVKRIVALGEQHAALAELAASAAPRSSASEHAEGMSLKQAARAASRQAERQLILKVLARTRWNRKRAAQELQISYKALLYKLKQIGLDDASAC